MSLSKEGQIRWLQNEIAKLSMSLLDSEDYVKSIKTFIACQMRMLEELVAEEPPSAGIKVEILPILELEPPPMRAGSTLLKAKFDVKVCASVTREFMDYCKVPAELMWVYGSPTVQHVELEDVFPCIGGRVSRWQVPLYSSIKTKVEEEAATFFETHEVLPSGSILPAPTLSTEVPKKNRTISLPIFCWVYVQDPP